MFKIQKNIIFKIKINVWKLWIQKKIMNNP
jgi:hypothetical protein